MSVYITLLDISAVGSEENGLGAPFMYLGSHVVPTDDSPRGGWVEVASIPAFCGPDPGRLVDFLRLDAGATEDGDPMVTKVLNRAQVKALRDTLTRWLNREVERG